MLISFDQFSLEMQNMIWNYHKRDRQYLQHQALRYFNIHYNILFLFNQNSTDYSDLCTFFFI